MKYSRAISCGIVVLLVVALFLFLKGYRKSVEREIEWAIQEHVEFLSEPFWNLDHSSIEIFLSILIARPEYQKIEVFDADSTSMLVAQSDPLSGVEGFLSRTHLINVNSNRGEIVRGGEHLGSVVVFWWDRSLIILAKASLGAILLYIIAYLYNSVSRTNKLLSDKIKDLHQALEEVRQQKEYIENIFHVVPEGLISINEQNQLKSRNHSFELIVKKWSERTGLDLSEVNDRFVARSLEELTRQASGTYIMSLADETIHISYASSALLIDGVTHTLLSVKDTTEMNKMQQRLAQTEKLESVGRLAAGVAHEINTPTQYVITNVDFLSEAFKDLCTAMEDIGQLPDIMKKEENSDDGPDYQKTIMRILDESDWDYLRSEIPESIKQSTEGLKRIQKIVEAMKQFSHPSGETPQACNINEAIETTVTVATSEWKYCATLNLDLEETLPLVPCYLDQFNQVVLNMIVNAAHAIEERFGATDSVEGQITISTRVRDDVVVCRISDNGAGMSPDVVKKVFDPFFTTKAVNRGTGQGLAIANDIIVAKHSGRIEVESNEGKGTAFSVCLPVS